MRCPDRILKLVEAEGYDPAEVVDAVPDPWIADVWALRCTTLTPSDGPWEWGLLVCADGEVEEVEWKTWPPQLSSQYR